MRTIGTANLETLSDAELKKLTVNCALDVHEGSVLGDAEYDFAVDTLERFLAERRRRKAA